MLATPRLLLQRSNDPMGLFQRADKLRYAGVEGTGSYGTGLALFLRKAGIAVFEVERPKRRHLRHEAKRDFRDAEAAARAVLWGEATGVPKSGDGSVEMIRVLRAVRCSAVKAKSQAANKLQGFLVTAPEELRQRLRELTTKELVAVAARLLVPAKIWIM